MPQLSMARKRRERFPKKHIREDDSVADIALTAGDRRVTHFCRNLTVAPPKKSTMAFFPFSSGRRDPERF
jgi:hypothetical protein